MTVTWMPDPLFTRVPYEELDDEHRARWDLLTDLTGQATSVEVLAQHPAAADFYATAFYPHIFFNADGDMLVELKLKELFRFRMGRMHGCHVCNSGNTGTVLAAGYTQEQVDHILEPTPEHFSDQELAIIDLADLFVLQHLDAHLTQDLYDRLRAYFSEAQILEFGVMGAFFMGWQRFIFAYDLVPREEACPFAPPTARTTV
jgi:alkylhydroperoxidase family enzyme